MTGAIQASPTAYPAPVVPLLTDRTIYDAATSPGTARAGLQLSETGELSTILAAGSTNRFPEWSRISSGFGGQWAARLTVVSGDSPTFSSITPGSWGSISGIIVWVVERSSLGDSIGSWRLDLRYGNNSAILATATYSVQASIKP